MQNPVHYKHQEENCRQKGMVKTMKEEYIKRITALLEKSNDMQILDLILRLLEKTCG